jgi:hypothetical protein
MDFMFRNALLAVAVALLATLVVALLVYLPRIAQRDRWVLVGTSTLGTSDGEAARAVKPMPTLEELEESYRGSDPEHLDLRIAMEQGMLEDRLMQLAAEYAAMYVFDRKTGKCYLVVGFGEPRLHSRPTLFEVKNFPTGE